MLFIATIGPWARFRPVSAQTLSAAELSSSTASIHDLNATNVIGYGSLLVERDWAGVRKACHLSSACMLLHSTTAPLSTTVLCRTRNCP